MEGFNIFSIISLFGGPKLKLGRVGKCLKTFLEAVRFYPANRCGGPQ